MKKLLLGVWIVVATAWLAHTMLLYPDVFPRPPKAISLWLVDVLHTKDAEDIWTTELYYALVVSFAVVSLLTAVVMIITVRFGHHMEH